MNILSAKHIRFVSIISILANIFFCSQNDETMTVHTRGFVRKDRRSLKVSLSVEEHRENKAVLNFCAELNGKEINSGHPPLHLLKLYTEAAGSQTHRPAVRLTIALCVRARMRFP